MPSVCRHQTEFPSNGFVATIHVSVLSTLLYLLSPFLYPLSSQTRCAPLPRPPCGFTISCIFRTSGGIMGASAAGE